MQGLEDTTQVFISEKVADEIVKGGQFLNQAGLCPATGGSLSIRIAPELVAITVSGKHKGELTSDDIMLVNLEGKAQYTTKKPSAETLLHTLVYALFDDAGCVLHTHSVDGAVLSKLLAPKNAMVTEGYEMHKAFRGITTHETTLTMPIFENSQDYPTIAAEVSAYLKTHPNVFGFFLRGHGLYTWGRDMKEAKIRVETFEYLFESELKLFPYNR